MPRLSVEKTSPAAMGLTATRLLRATARVFSSFRPPVPNMALTDNRRTYNPLALVWGVIPIVCPHASAYDDMLVCARETVLTRGLARKGQRVVLTAGLPLHAAGTTNTLRVVEV